MESNDEAFNINSLPEEMLINIFFYLSQNKLGQIARVCRKWNVLTRSPVLWRKVTVEFVPSHESQTTIVKCFINLLPPCVTYIKLHFREWFESKWTGQFDFEELSVELQKRCPHLETLILDGVILLNSLPSIIGLCIPFLPNVKTLMFHHSAFPDCPATREFCADSKIEVLVLSLCDLGHFNKPPFSRMSYLKELCLNDNTDVRNSWFHDNTSFINELHVLDLGYTKITARTFSTIQNHGLNLEELFLCGTDFDDYDLYFNNSSFPLLKTICLKHCRSVTCEGVVSLVQSCQSLQNVYVNKSVAILYATHPFIVANTCKLEIAKVIFNCSGHQRLSYVSNIK